jgi:pre-mRNA-splicing factor CDC5/CEF1
MIVSFNQQPSSNRATSRAYSSTSWYDNAIGSIKNFFLMKVIIKGGVWKNTEDEILKAAVMKYGKNEWARISSLLVRKTPQQCKARWYEWIDPSIKKTEWSKEEDEKLLHLAKLMPTQWRTIAPIVGRTAAQCLERYQHLLDEAEKKEGDEQDELALQGAMGGHTGPSADDVRRLRPGEIDPDPETKPARPDPIDMDEDEKEMLSEARARLANTQGKKAKRKARERQMEESKRLSFMQKRREMRASGILMGYRLRKGEMDYNVDIPLERKPMPGFYDTQEEHEREKLPREFRKQTLQEFEGPSKKKELEALKRAQHGKPPAEVTFVPAKESEEKRRQDEDERIAKRRKLHLPAPQVGEHELEQIVKLGSSGEFAQSMVNESEHEATRSLMGSYSIVDAEKTLAIRTPRLEAHADTVMQQARTLLAMKNVQTPLLGGENTPLHVGFETSINTNPFQTPNPLITPLQGGAFKTPLRDEMGINTSKAVHDDAQQLASMKRKLALDLDSLPAPKNDFEIVLPDVDMDDVPVTSIAVEDAGDVAERLRQQQVELEKERVRLSSQAMQRDLPCPNVNALLLSTTLPEDPIDQLIQQEMHSIVVNDAKEYPDRFTQLPARLPVLTKSSMTVHELDAVTSLIDQELMTDYTHDTLQQDVNALAQQLDGLFVSQESPQDTYHHVFGRMTRDAALADKLETKSSILLGGYQARSKSLMSQIQDAWQTLTQLHVDVASYSQLAIQEDAAIPLRIQELEHLVHTAQRHQGGAQSRYATLLQQRDQLYSQAHQ